MNFNDHWKVEGQHAFLSASKYHWINYDNDRLIETYLTAQAAQKGTELHEFAAQCIRLKQKLPSNKKTLNMYVNDAIGFRLHPEQVLYYSDNCFGTADAIDFKEKDSFLRIHDLKTGSGPTHMEQLMVYAALFCLEYGIKPGEIQYETRIYQNNDIWIENPTAEDIAPICDKIISFDKLINSIKED